MIKTITPILFLFVIFLSCNQTRHITEQEIKNNIQQHAEGQFSTIRTFPVYQGTSQSGSSYLELTGYKYGNTKALLIGADKYYKDRKRFQGDNSVTAEITYIELSLSQVKSILDNYETLQKRIKKESPKQNEEVYHDFAVSKDLFIGYKTSRSYTSVAYMYFWVKGEKFVVSTNEIMKNLQKFMEY